MEKKIISGVFKKLGFILFSLLIFISGFSAEKKKAINALEHPLFIELMKLPYFRISYGTLEFMQRVKINVSSKASHPSKANLGSWTNISVDQYTIYINPNKLAKTYVLDEDYRPFTPSILRALALELAYVSTVDFGVNNYKKPQYLDLSIIAGEYVISKELMPKAVSRLTGDKCSHMFGLTKDLNKSSYSSCGTASTNSYSSKSKGFYSNTSKDFYADTSKDFYSTTSKDIYSAKSNTNSKQNCDEYDLKQKRKKYFSSCQKMFKDASNYDAYKSGLKSDAEVFAEIEAKLRKSQLASQVLDWKKKQPNLKIKFDDKTIKISKESGKIIPAWGLFKADPGTFSDEAVVHFGLKDRGRRLDFKGTIIINRDRVKYTSFLGEDNKQHSLKLEMVYFHEIVHLYIENFNPGLSKDQYNKDVVFYTNKVRKDLDSSSPQRLNHADKK